MHNRPLLPEEMTQRSEIQLKNEVPTLCESEPEQPDVPRRRSSQGRAITFSIKAQQDGDHVAEPLPQSRESRANIESHLWKAVSVLVDYLTRLMTLLTSLDHAIRLWMAFKALRHQNILNHLLSHPDLIPQASS